MSGLALAYASSGDKVYKENWIIWFLNSYIYSTGGVGTDEVYKTPYAQGNSILGTAYGNGRNCETCCAYNMLKLTMVLYNYNPDNAKYMDYFERTLINHIAASQSHETTEYRHNGVTYMLPIDPGQIKTFDSDYGGFTCCNGTGMENHVKYQAAAYAHTDDCLYVNLYMPTTVTWDEKNVTVKQETEFPSEYSKLTVSGSGTFSMKLRVPYWARDGFTVRVNDEVICTAPEVSSYVEITRMWSDGDVVSMQMPYAVHLDKTPDKVDGSIVASLMYGPLVMAAKDERETYTAMNWYKIALGSQQAESIEIAVGTDEENLSQLNTNGLEFYLMYDICDYEWYGLAVRLASENGIVTGYLDGNFGPADLITREQMAVMMYRYAKYMKEDTEITAQLDAFTDAKQVSAFAKDAMEWVVGTSIITGKENGTKLDPQGNTARAEAAVIIQRFLDK